MNEAIRSTCSHNFLHLGELEVNWGFLDRFVLWRVRFSLRRPCASFFVGFGLRKTALKLTVVFEI